MEASSVSNPICDGVHLPRRNKGVKGHLNLKLHQYSLLCNRVRDRLWRLKWKCKVIIDGSAKKIEETVSYRHFILLNINHKLRRRRRSNIQPAQLKIIQNNVIGIKLVRLVDLVVCENDHVRPWRYFWNKFALFTYSWLAFLCLDIKNFVKICVEVAPKGQLC